ncbi:MAG: hypothetical protein ACRYHQ_40230 [Janthinobacterium lividum]
MRLWPTAACLALLAGPAHAEMPANYDPNVMCEGLAQRAAQANGLTGYRVVRNDCLRSEKAAYAGLEQDILAISPEHRQYCARAMGHSDLMLYRRMASCVQQFLDRDAVEPPFRP